jgi:hypothetical protein
MPYIVTTKRPGYRPSRIGYLDDMRVVSRRAVATLEDARAAAQEACSGPDFMGPLEASLISESGGTVGPLPDGTVIEVERVDAYNARQ